MVGSGAGLCKAGEIQGDKGRSGYCPIRSGYWKKGDPCFKKVTLTRKIEKKYYNFSAKKINNKLRISQWKKKGIIFKENASFKNDYKAGLIMPDGKPDTPIFLVFSNYEKILKWNRSLRFGISVCTLAEMIN